MDRFYHRNGVMAHVFISYSRKDTDFVNQVEQALRAEGIVTWRDVHSIPGGAKWFRRIKQGLEASYAMLYIDTLNAEQSDWVEREFLYAAALGLPIIPLKLDPTFFNMRTINLNPVFCDEGNFRAGMGKVIAQLATLPRTPIVSGALPPPEPDRVEREDDPAPDTPPPDFDLSAELRSYVKWALVKWKADLLDVLYVDLQAQTQAPQRHPAPSPDEDDDLFGGLSVDPTMSMGRLGLEHVRGENFDERGDPVPDARVPVKEAQRVVLLGEPGSGKTTTLLQLAVDLARALEDDPNAPVPVFVPLRKYDGKDDFERFVRAQMYNLQDAYAQLVSQREVIFLLDALNEMPRSDDAGRELLPDVQDFAREQPRWVISCRVRDYQEELSEIAGVSKVRLQPLDPPRIQEVILRRMQAAGSDDGEALWEAIYGSEALLRAWDLFVQHNRAGDFWGQEWPDEVKPEGEQHSFFSPGYREWWAMRRDKRRMLHLCRNPYMTKMVCDLYANDRELPQNRGGLFKRFVDTLLERDRKAAQAVGAAWIDDDWIRVGLARIAFQMGSETEMPYEEAQALLREHLPAVDHGLLLRLAQGASLLDVGASVRFTHQLLQEYFASEVLGMDVDAGVDPATYWQPGKWWQPNGREETAIILAGVRGDPEAVARWIAPAQPEFALEVIRESGVGVTLEALAPETRQAIVDGANGKLGEENPVGRAAAYRALGTLNADHRPGIGMKDGLPDIAWSKVIPPGEYPIGGDEDVNALIPLPAQRYKLERGFQISQYPITNAQFEAFVNAEDGYRSAEHDWFEGLAADESDRQIREEPSFPYANHPRVDVNWYQALAFCRWLSWKLEALTPDPSPTAAMHYPQIGERR